MMKTFLVLAAVACVYFVISGLYRRNRLYDEAQASAARDISSSVNKLFVLFNRGEIRWAQARHGIRGELVVHFSGETQYGTYEVSLTDERLEAKGELPAGMTDAVEESLTPRLALIVLEQLAAWCAGKKEFKIVRRDGAILVSIYRSGEVFQNAAPIEYSAPA